MKPTPDINMTREQKRLVRDSFEALSVMAEPLALLFYGRLFEIDPQARKLFHNDLRLQGRKLMDMLAVVVESLDQFDRIRPKLEELGRRHAGYGVTLEQYNELSLALQWALAQALQGDFDRDTRAAWAAVIGAVSESMKAGAQS